MGKPGDFLTEGYKHMYNTNGSFGSRTRLMHQFPYCYCEETTSPHCAMRKRRIFVSRYQVRRRGTNRTFVDRRGPGSRLQGIVIAVLLVAVIIGLIYAGPAIRQRAEEDDLVRGRLLSECEAAVTRVQRLSRTAGSNSSQTLGEIRSYVYSMDVLNQVHFSLTGRQLIDSSYFSTIYSLLETYWSQLLSGSDTGAMQTALTNALGEVYTAVQKLN